MQRNSSNSKNIEILLLITVKEFKLSAICWASTKRFIVCLGFWINRPVISSHFHQAEWIRCWYFNTFLKNSVGGWVFSGSFFTCICHSFCGRFQKFICILCKNLVAVVFTAKALFSLFFWIPLIFLKNPTLTSFHSKIC